MGSAAAATDAVRIAHRILRLPIRDGRKWSGPIDEVTNGWSADDAQASPLQLLVSGRLHHAMPAVECVTTPIRTAVQCEVLRTLLA